MTDVTTTDDWLTCSARACSSLNWTGWKSSTLATAVKVTVEAITCL